MTQLEREVANKYYGSTHCKRKHANRTLKRPQQTDLHPKSWAENLTIGVFFDEINVYEKSFKSLDKLEKAITNYIFDYNKKRIKTKLKGLSPVQYGTESLQ